jgi:hypothetical protein
MLKWVAFLLWITGIGCGIPCVMAIRNLMAGRPIPIVMGFPAYGGGPFERHGIDTSIPLLVGFFIVCVLEVVAGWLVWGGNRSGAFLSLIAIPIGAVYWWGFALPFPPLFALVRTTMLTMAWPSLK